MTKSLSTCGVSQLPPQRRESISGGIFYKGVAILSAHFPNLVITEERTSIWREMLGDLTPEQFLRGVKAFCLAHKEIYPNTNLIAHLREYALRDPKSKTGMEAWGEVLLQLRRVGSWGKPEFSDPLITRVVESMGWYDMCQSDKIDVVRGQFLKMFDALVSRENFNVVARMG